MEVQWPGGDSVDLEHRFPVVVGLLVEDCKLWVVVLVVHNMEVVGKHIAVQVHSAVRVGVAVVLRLLL